MSFCYFVFLEIYYELGLIASLPLYFCLGYCWSMGLTAIMAIVITN